MPARCLLDTNIVSYLLKNQIPAVQSRYFEAGADSIAISSITEAEIFYGIANRPGATRLRIAAEEFFAAATVLSWDSAAARSYGQLRADQQRKGRPLSTEDLMIAAHALSLGLTLVTHDGAFSYVDGLKTEDWTVGQS
jgi:tRNA(fMet)-specific endonuclease VapC